ncbi:efflux RND transporter periplasmic adaptor subunit [Rhodopirellula sp. SWK7]|uniref:efflux RND transporter periplasmic adaptor subunit n=1 Tax=Rhodopirellula sp. SWK7 TaxID=595460 RepID=UPI0002BFC6AD|nr:efflux RND transporter periplasmic adaptor subunit [Rhodopirellula sp. SWK7]EMI41129.1 efflux transporter, RND family, MFP subunit [Rhodopirellula sp. SWK7]
MKHPPATGTRIDWLRVILSLFACAGILAASVGAVVWINRTEPVAQTINAKRKSAALVETITLQRGTYRPKITVLGTVQAAREVDLSPRVSGQVVEMSQEFIPGGIVKQGTVLLKIDRADFENALLISKSELEQVQASLDIESGRQSLARKELAMLEGTIEATNRALVLRQPQIASIRAEVKAAEAAVQRAQLDLDRTEVVAPFDAQILTRSVNVGSQVSTGDELGRLVGIDEYWISAAVPVRSLRWINFGKPPTDTSQDLPRSRVDAERETAADDDAEEQKPHFKKEQPRHPTREGSQVTIRDADAWGPDAHRTGTVSRMIGALDEQTRLARVLITVPDPLANSSDAPPLILGSLIDVEIEGRTIQDVIRLPRDYLRDGDTVWVMEDNQLRIHEADVFFRDAQFVYIRDGIDDGDEVITTTLATVADGVNLRKVEGKPDEESFADEEDDADANEETATDQASEEATLDEDSVDAETID